MKERLKFEMDIYAAALSMSLTDPWLKVDCWHVDYCCFSNCSTTNLHDCSLHDCSFCEIANLSLFPLSDLSLYCHHPCCNTMSPAVADSSNAGQLMGSQEKDQSGCLLPKLVLISTRPERPKGMKDVMKQAWRVQSLGPQICRGAPRTSSWQYCSDCFAICDDLVFAEIEAQAGAGKQESARSK